MYTEREGGRLSWRVQKQEQILIAVYAQDLRSSLLDASSVGVHHSEKENVIPLAMASSAILMQTAAVAVGAVQAPTTPPTTPRGCRGDLSAGKATLEAIGGDVPVRLRFDSGLTVKTKVDKHTTICELREGLLRISGGSRLRDEAVLEEMTGKLHEEPFSQPFEKAGDEDTYQVIVRPFGFQTYYRDLMDRT